MPMNNYNDLSTTPQCNVMLQISTSDLYTEITHQRRKQL